MRFILIAFIAIVLPVYGEQKSANPAGDQKQVQGVKEPSPSSPHIAVIEQEHPADQSNPANNHTDNYLYELFSANNLPSILLFVAGLGGIAVGVYTLRDIRTQTRLLGEYVTATKNSTEAMEKSVGLQEVQLRQWLDIHDLNVDCPFLETNTLEAVLTITFNLVNSTKMPLTLKDVEITLFDEEEPSVYYRSLEYTLLRRANYPVSIEVLLLDKALQRYKNGTFIIPLTGLITFEDAFEKTRHQGFGFTCRWQKGQWELTLYDKPIPKNKKGEGKKEGENPN